MFKAHDFVKQPCFSKRSTTWLHVAFNCQKLSSKRQKTCQPSFKRRAIIHMMLRTYINHHLIIKQLSSIHKHEQDFAYQSFRHHVE